MRTLSQIEAEINALKTIKPNVLKGSNFSGNHHDAIDAQIHVLENRTSINEIYDTYGDEGLEDFAQNVLDSAIEAHEWLQLDAKPSLADEWQELVR